MYKLVDKIQTKIPQLDEFLNGGIEIGSLSSLWMKPGLDGSAFSYQMANSFSKSMKVFYILNSKDIRAVKSEMKALKINSKNINFVDSYSPLVGIKPSHNLVISNPKNTDEIINDISLITKKFKNPLIIFDSLSTLIDLAEEENTKFLLKLKKLKVTTLCLFTEWPYSPKFIKSLKDSFDNIIELKSVEEQLFFRQYFGVTKVKTGQLKSQIIPYKVIRPGGVKIYVPKILVTGPFNAGKTSFIHTASVKAVSVDRLGTTIALDHGHVRYKGFALDLFGTPGQQRFDPILKLLGGESLGVIVVISATDPQGYPRAIEMMKRAKVHNLPVVFALNKADLKGALTPKQVKVRMGIKDAEIIPVTAKDLTKVQPGIPCQLNQRDLEKVLISLFGKLLSGGLK
jgi:uncharacterized protein